MSDGSAAHGSAGRLLGAAACVVVIGGAVAALALTRGGDGSEASAEPVELATAEVLQQDLVTYDETTATLGFTDSVTVSSPVAGTVTSVVAEGDSVEAGSVVATIDGDPVVALVGDIPGWRDLSSSSDDGVDIRQLETNLVLLGFDPDGAIVIDEEFDDATEAAVDLWEASLGLDPDGEVPQSQVVYVGGSLLVDSVSATVGGAVSSGAALVTGRQTQRSFLVPAAAPTTIVVGRFADAGTEVTTGTTLFERNELPVAAIVGDVSALPALARDLSVGVDDGMDVKLLEQMLASGGFDPDGTMTVDDEFDTATVSAVMRWWQANDVPFVDLAATDVTVPAGSFVVVPSGLETNAVLVADGTTLEHDTVVMNLSKPARVVTTTAPLGDDTFQEGATIDVVFPDGTEQTGIVTDVGNVATNTSGTPGENPSVTITIEVDGIPDSAASFVEIPVTLRVVAEEIPDAFVVPVSALLALAEGGYALEVVTGTAPDGTATTSLVAVEVGLFSDGFVEVTGEDLAAGLEVVVPS